MLDFLGKSLLHFAQRVPWLRDAQNAGFSGGKVQRINSLENPAF